MFCFLNKLSVKSPVAGMTMTTVHCCSIRIQLNSRNEVSPPSLAWICVKWTTGQWPNEYFIMYFYCQYHVVVVSR